MNTTVEKVKHHANLKSVLTEELNTRGDLKNSLIESAKDIASGLLGAATGAIIGRPSFFVALPAIFVAEYVDNKLLKNFSVGMLSSGGYKLAKGLSGVELTGLEGAKQRLKAYGEDLKQRLYLDKLTALVGRKKTEVTKGADGTGATAGIEGAEQFDPLSALSIGALENIEQELLRQSQQHVSGNYEDMSGLDEDINY